MKEEHSLTGKNKKHFELEFLWEISKSLGSNFTPEDIVIGLKNVFTKFFKISNLQIFIYENSSNCLKDFRKDWCIVSNDNQSPQYLDIFQQLTSSVRLRFIVNNQYFILNDDFECMPEINFENDVNKVYLPITQGAQTIGMMEVILSEIDQNFLSKNFLTALAIATSQISVTITNKKLQDKLTKSTNFYRSMKNIAKILENQYELSFIIPMIGEIIDRFASEHFIYIFEFTDDSFNLLWPSNYDKERICPLLKLMKNSGKTEISKDSIIGVFPLKFDNELKGAIVADGKYTKLSKIELEYIAQLTKQASITIDRANTYAEIQKYATFDALTGLNNRRSLELKISQEIAVLKRKKTLLCAMMLDIDFFKSINDNYGHSAGDFILKEFARIIKEEIREYDFAARYGGEEFCIILPSANIEESMKVAQRLKQRLEAETFDISQVCESIENVGIRASIGICEFKDDYSPAILISCADKALYEAKQTGRNKIVVYNNEQA